MISLFHNSRIKRFSENQWQIKIALNKKKYLNNGINPVFMQQNFVFIYKTIFI